MFIVHPIRFRFALLLLCWLWLPTPSLVAGVRTGDPIEMSFDLPNIQGNPFDCTTNDVQVTLSTPAGNQISIPAFFDGNATWRARLTADSPGRYLLKSITLNGTDARAQSISRTEFDCPQGNDPGFVRIDPNDKMRFAFDDGSPFYPVGYNLAWRSHGEVEMPPLVDSLDRMGKAGVNWTRIWMNSWDGKNLDWPSNKADRVEPGMLLLPVARDWDAIVQAAQKNHVYFQMVLQHHGQYSTTADNNWTTNPWNKSNGGWLEKPAQFFTDPKAIQLTKNKFRYIIARWGYSPAIMAFELCNEVESTDAFKSDLPSVAAWHQTMARFIREQDHYHHLITTSSNTGEKSIWPATDYYQAHAYPSDLIAAISGLDDQKLDRAYFFGEIGSSSTGNPPPPRDTLHQILWASLMSGSAGTGEYWDWFDVEPQNLLGQFTSIQQFIHQSGMLADRNLHPVILEAQTPERGPLAFGPGRDWGKSASTQYTVNPNGTVPGLGGMSAFLQGRGKNHDLFPFAEFNVNFAEPGTFTTEIDQTHSAGARLEASLDGKPISTLIIGKLDRPNRRSRGEGSNNPTNPVNAALELPIPAGPHMLRLQNTGQDWIHIRQFVLSPYASQLAVLAKAGPDRALVWIYRRPSGTAGDSVAGIVTGTFTIPSLQPGAYNVVWWDTEAGKVIQTTTAQADTGKPVTLTTPPVSRDIACWVERRVEK